MKKWRSFSLLGVAFLALSQLCPVNAAGDQRLEVFSWWTSGSEATALDALFEAYRQKNPGVEILNAAITGGGGSAARLVLQTRLAEGNPPDTWLCEVDPGHVRTRGVFCKSLIEFRKALEIDRFGNNGGSPKGFDLFNISIIVEIWI